MLAKTLPRPPLYHYPGLSALLDAEVYVKHENHSPVGSFKARGALVAVTKALEAGAAGHRRGAAWRGSPHPPAITGWAWPYAGRQLGVSVTVYVPEGR